MGLKNKSRDEHSYPSVISRRQLMKTAATTLIGARLLPIGNSKAVGFRVEYIRKTIPSLSIPAYKGKSYTDRVPDTLDLAERAHLAINALTRIPDPAADYEIYFVLQANRRPAVMWHEWSDYTGGQPKFMEALTLLRTVTGSNAGMEAELGMMRAAAGMLGADGLYYQPIGGRSWALRGSTNKPVTQDPKVIEAGQFTDAYSCGRMLLAMTLFYQRDQNPFWREMSERMIARIAELAIKKDDFAYLKRPFIHPGFMTPGGKLDSNATPEPGPFTYSGIIHGLTRYYKLTSHEPALKLAGRFSRFMRDHSGFYDSEGKAKINSHFHGGTVTLLAMLEYAHLVEDRALLEFVRRSYEWYRTIGSSTVGFFPESANSNYLTAESCEIANMINLAVRLSQVGAGDYWDDADRYLRNQFAENQLIRGEWIEQLSSRSPRQPVAEYETSDKVVQSSIGAFAGWATGNDFIPEPVGELPRGMVFMHCCTGNGSRALYYAWQGILDYTNGQLKINLLLNRASPWADIHSYLPYAGKIQITLRQGCQVAIRIPSWVDRTKIGLKVAGKPLNGDWENNYLIVPESPAKSAISVEFPMSERSLQETIGGGRYTLTLRGNEVVAIDPPGKYCPLYQRDHYRKGPVSWKKVRRFLSDEKLVI